MKNHFIAVIALFLIIASFRSYTALEQPYFNDDRAYFALRQTAEIIETGTPLYNDPLSYGGRQYVFLPLYYYILSLGALLSSPVFAAKLIPNLFASSIVFAAYLISKFMTKDKDAALVSACASGLIPIFISETLNSASVQSVALPLTFFLIYFLLRLRMKRMLYLFIITLCLFLLISTYSILVVLAMLIFLGISWVEGYKPTRQETELTIFSVFLCAWFYLLFYRDALLMHGYSVIWQNIPAEVLQLFFTDVDVLTLIYQVGVLPLIACAFVLYYYLVRKMKKHVYLFLSLALVITLLLLNKYMELRIGLSYIGVIGAILLGEMIIIAKTYLERTKFSYLSKHTYAGFLLLVLVTSLIPAIQAAGISMEKSDSKEKVFGIQLLRNATIGDATVAGSVFDGHLINYYSGRKNIVDSNFLLVNAEERMRDTRTIYTSAIQSKALELFEKYGVEYFIVTNEAMKYYNISKVAYVDSSCLPLFYTGKNIKIYEVKC